MTIFLKENSTYLFGFGSKVSGFGFGFFDTRFGSGCIFSVLVKRCRIPGVIFNKNII